MKVTNPIDAMEERLRVLLIRVDKLERDLAKCQKINIDHEQRLRKNEMAARRVRKSIE